MAAGAKSWITYAGNDKEALKVIVLIRSLKRVSTRMSSTVFVAHTVSDHLGSLLEEECERCIRMTEVKCGQFEGIEFGAIALLHSWGLIYLKTFVFLDCNSLVVKNSDELFKTVGTSFQRNGTRIPMVVDHPCKAVLKKMMSDVVSGRWNLLQDLIGYLPTLEEKYNVAVDLDGSPLIRDLNDMKILLFNYRHPIELFMDCQDLQYKLASAGSFERKAVSLALEIFTADGLSEALSENFKIDYSNLKNYLNNSEHPSNPSIDPNLGRNLRDSIAIIGMSFRLPGANNIDEFWDLLINGKDGIIKLPDNRWSDERCIGKTDSCKDNEAGFLNCPVDQMDSKFFGLSPAELANMDPQQRITLLVTWEALEHSGINPQSLKNTATGVFGGWCKNDYAQLLDNSVEQDFLKIYMATGLGSLAGRISHMLGITGPCIATESGCSTSMVGVDMACKNLRNETCDLGLAFGVNLIFRNSVIKTMHSVYAPDSHCKTFDAKADGFGRAEGCTVLVLKRYPDAVRDGDRVLGLIRDSAMVQEGPSRSLGTPTVQCEALAMKLALEDAGVEPNEVSFVETHGTGTPVGDPIEVAAMTAIYSKNRKDVLTIGSVKTNIGHTESCSGIAGIIKTILALQHEVIPPHRNFKTLNPELNLDALPAQIPLTPFPWKRNMTGVPRIAGVSSFGITGTDAHAIIQEAPDVLPRTGLQLTSSQPFNVLKLSAKSEEALEEMVKLYIKFLSETKEDLEDICYTANTGRADFQHRVAIVTSNKSDLLQKMSKHVFEKKLAPSGAPKVCFLFTGQGSQYPGMAKSLYEYCPTFKMHFDSCDILLQREIGINIKDALWGQKVSDLGRTLYSQTSIFCVEYCLLKLWESWGVTPDIVLGHSLGEFAAAVAAGVLEFKDALKLVAERSRLIDDLPRGKMLVIKDNLKNVDTLLNTAFDGTEKWLDIAAINSPDQTVLAGSVENVGEFSEFCKNHGLKTHILDATHAFHSRNMDPMLNECTEIASKIKYMTPTCTFISGMEGGKVNDVDADFWVQHTRRGVRFIEASKSVLTESDSGRAPLFLEIGPTPVLSALTMNNSDKPLVCLPSLRKNTDDWSTLLTTLGKLYLHGFTINWENFHQYSTTKKVTLPFYPFQNKPYWYKPKDEVQSPIHPLIGTPLSSPSSQKVFQNSLEINKALLYLKDHEIGNKIIFPMAGFIEMCLFAGHSAIQCEDGDYSMPNTPLTIQNFQIEGSLCLTDNVKTHLQTIVSSEDAGETRVTIYSKVFFNEKSHRWVGHAAGTFLPYVVKTDGKEIAKIESLEAIKSRCKVQCTTDIYAKFRIHGLKLGPLFQTCVDLRTGDNGEIFNRVILRENSEGYILHPIIIDAMIRAIAVGHNQDPTCLSVPVSVSKFIWFAKLKTEICYVYVDQDRGSHRTVVLYDDHGQVIAQMVGLTLIDTTIGTMMSTLEAQHTSLPNMYQEVWRAGLGPLDRRVKNPASICDDTIFSKSFKKATEHFNFFEGNDQKFYDKSNQLCILYIIHGLYELGWSHAVGNRLKLEDLMQALNVVAKHEGIFRYILTELAIEGYLKILDEDVTEFEVEKLFPSKEEVMTTTDSLFAYLDSNNIKEIHTVESTGRILSSILNGKTDALPILFPEDSETIGPAEAYYIESLPSKCSKKLASHIFGEKLFLNSARNGRKEVYRILEVGAGTGSFTKALIPNLKGPKSSYEYTYTDISPAFFGKGEKVFQDSGVSVIYATLNLELDPLTQGFIPHYYDVIYAAYVVHATKDTRESISHLRNLLRPGGLLILIEIVKPHLGINLTFGMLEGYWRFTDTELRPFNCEMSTAKWLEVLKELRFSKTASYDILEGLCSLIFAQASEESEYLLYSDVKLNPKLKTWISFDEDGEFGDLLASNLVNLGRRIVRIKQNLKQFKKLLKISYQIRPNESVDMEEVFKIVAQEEWNLEGIVYSWALNYEEADYSVICQPYLHLCQNLVPLNKIKLVAFTKGLISLGDHELRRVF